MPMVFGCVDGARELEGGNDHIEPTLGTPSRAAFEGGHFTAVAHYGRKAAWRDPAGNAWAVFGERGLSSPIHGADEELPFRLDEHRKLVLAPEARGVVSVFDSTSRKLTLACDWLNYFPVYYWHSGRRFLFGSHLKSLARLTGATFDFAGIVEFLRSNWCLNGRTVFDGIRRILPGQVVE